MKQGVRIDGQGKRKWMGEHHWGETEGEANSRRAELKTKVDEAKVTPLSVFLSMVNRSVINHFVEASKVKIEANKARRSGRVPCINRQDVLLYLAWYLRVSGEKWLSFKHGREVGKDLPISKKKFARIGKWLPFNPVVLFQEANKCLRETIKVCPCIN